MASKPIKKVLQSIRNGKSIALAIAESDANKAWKLDPTQEQIPSLMIRIELGQGQVFHCLLAALGGAGGEGDDQMGHGRQGRHR